MPQFKYVARKSDGQLIDGVLTCNDRSAAIRQVEQQGGIPIKIEPITAQNGAAASPSSSAKGSASASNKPAASQSSPVASGPVKKIPHTHLYLFTEQLAHLLGAGMTLDEALGILVKRLKQPGLQGLSQSLHQGLIDGRSLSQAMRDFPRIFSPLYVNMVSAGEASGALSDILRRLVTHLADVKALRDRVQQALVYPAILVVAGIGLIIIFMTVMVPQLTQFFKQTGQDLPLATRVLLEANRILTHYWWMAIVLGAAIYGAFKVFTRTPEGQRVWHKFVWRFPLISIILQYRYFAQFARTLGTLVDNGVTLLRALQLLEEISGNEFVRQRMTNVSKAIVDGATLSVALNEQKVFPELFIDMMAVGEQSGKFGETMHMIAEVYERELDQKVKLVSSLIPPLIMFVIASVVGLVVYGILSAVFGLTQGLRAGAH